MSKFICCALVISGLTVGIVAQNENRSTAVRPHRVVVTDNTAKVPKPTPTPIIVGSPVNRDSEVVTVPDSRPVPAPVTRQLSRNDERTLSFREIKSKLAEAKRTMQTRPIATSSVGSVFEGVEMVRVAFHDWHTEEIDYVVMLKEVFLSTAGDKPMTSQNGRPIIIRTIRGNGVNTPITIMDDKGIAHLPLMVQYPVVREKKYHETAYYMSTHPGLVTPEVVNAGRIYVRNVIEIAREKLNERGIRIQPKTADIAERLATVEHVDHLRFRTEPHQNIYNDVFTLFALNEGQTYRYAVSTAGAGGMVQMIPSTYRMVRAQYPQVPLMPDFVEGMRDHVNAAQAMLLYMQWTWDDLKSRPAVSNALLTGIATQEQLMAAGYNSNPARLPGYITRGGAGWANLIPRETKIYLQIYESLENNVPMTPRNK